MPTSDCADRYPAGEFAWPDKYVKTNGEPIAFKEHILDPRKREISPEAKGCVLNSSGRSVYEVEKLLDPGAAGPAFFNVVAIERLIAACAKTRHEKARLAFWTKYYPLHPCALGADTRKSNRDDHGTFVLSFYDPQSARAGT